MGFCENLQLLRKRHAVTQEQLAERLEVSRQSVSKWESGASFPEMEKLLELCEMFSCSLDDLLRGNLAQVLAEDTAGYDAHMNWFSRIIAGGVGLILLGVATGILLESMRMPEAVSGLAIFLFVIPAVLLFVVGGMQHAHFSKKHPQIEPFYSAAVLDDTERRFITHIAGGIGLILCGVLIAAADPLLPVPRGCSRDIYGAALLLFLSAGVPLLVYGGIQKSKFDLKAYNKEHLPDAQKSRREVLESKACGVIMLLATMVFLGLGFLLHLWDKAWVVFPIGGLLCAVVSVVLEKE